MYDYVLNLFRSQDELRPHMQVPMKVGAKVYCTDGSSMIQVPFAKIKQSYNFDQKPIDFQKVINESHEEKLLMVVTVSELLEELGKARICYQMKACGKCEGTGEHTCDECNHTHDCDSCGGSGDSTVMGQIRFTYTDMENKNYAIQIGQKFFQAHFIERLVIVALAKGIKSVQLINNTPNSKMGLFKCGDILVGLMPLTIKTTNPY